MIDNWMQPVLSESDTRKFLCFFLSKYLVDIRDPETIRKRSRASLPNLFPHSLLYHSLVVYIISLSGCTFVVSSCRMYCHRKYLQVHKNVFRVGVLFNVCSLFVPLPLQFGGGGEAFAFSVRNRLVQKVSFSTNFLLSAKISLLSTNYFV